MTNVEDIIDDAEVCYDEIGTTCPGDSGDILCFFCKACVLSPEERVGTLREVLE